MFYFFKEKNEPPNKQLEEEWENRIAEQLSRLLQGLEEVNVDKTDVCPFDALSEVSIDDQKFDVLFSLTNY